MSIKDLFNKGHSLKFIKNKTQDDLAEDLESYNYIDAYAEKRARFIPDVDFTTASNFARFGLAEEYYDSSIKRVYQTYPYDGSQTEKIQWENDSTYLDLFIFENEYPRTNGFVIFNSSSHTYTSTRTAAIYSSSLPQYVSFFGGPHADPSGDYKSDFSAGPSQKGISKANIYHAGSQRTNNLEFDLEKGVTVEFWMKKGGWAGKSPNAWEVLFSNVTTGSLDSDDYMVMYAVDSSKPTLYVEINSGATNHTFSHNTGLSDIGDDVWHHYAFTAKTVGTGTETELYVDGSHVSSVNSASKTFSAITSSLVGAVGALSTEVDGEWGAGWGNVVSASFDEFRYWKTRRNAQQIGRFYRDQIGGGTNTDNAKYDDVSNKVDLGVYYKFNEGITGISATDSTVLDYSGRISNGTFVNYESGCRNVNSAIVLSKAATKEFKDPIIYSSHPDVAALAHSKKVTGSAHDHENAVSIYKSVPGWILEEDEKKSNNLKFLTQIIASYFDDLYLQIEKLPRLKDINYPYDTNYEKPLPFAERLLSSRGYDTPELFAGASDLAKYLERDEKILFEKKLYEVKNIIYQNIYNNLSFIQKSKGTFKSLRNFLRCFGVDEELIKLNIYSNNDTYEFKDNETHTAIRKKYIDFDDLETRYTASGGYYDGSYEGIAYQYYDSSDSNSLSYIPGASEGLLTGAMMTIETEVFFPKRSIVGDKNYQMFPALTASIFGLHSAITSSNQDLTFDSNNNINFNVVVTKPDNDLRNVKFGLLSSGTSIFSDLQNASSFAGVYDNEKWNLALRIRPTKAKTDTTPQLKTSTGYLEPASTAYTYELYGVNYLSNVLQDEFTLTGSMSLADATTFFTKAKRIFIGANRTNFTGSVIRSSDVKVSSTRVWLDYLPDSVIKAHARDASSHGALQPYTNTNDSLNANYVPQISSLILNWTMDNITGSNSSGQFLIEDFASGSVNYKHKFGDDWAKSLSRYNYAGRGDKFVTNTNFADQAVDVEFVQSAKLKLPEIVNSDDMVKILNKQDDVVFTRDTTYVQHLLSVEKSMYQIISEEMLRLFATITDFNNLVGEPVNRYRPHYKKIEKLRELFFESVENERLDLDKFIEYFKWIDDAVTIMISQLIPVSSNSVDVLRNMVESHILERNKYWSKFPTLEVVVKEPIASLKAIEELKYNWKWGHAPLAAEENTNQDENCLWWKQRAERDDVLSSGDSSVDSNKNVVLKTYITEVSGAGPNLKTVTGTKYAGSHYYNRSLARPIDLVTHKSRKVKSGPNPDNNNRHDFYKGVIKWGSDDDYIFLDLDNEIKSVVCNDAEIPDELDKKHFKFRALTMFAHETLNSNAQGTGINDKKYTDAKSTLLLPFTVYSGSIGTGYQELYSDQFKIDFTNVHHDVYGPDSETPLQGPFTKAHVGGMQHRHVLLNRGTDTVLTRPEGWHLQEFLNAVAGTIFQENFLNAPAIVASDDPEILGVPTVPQIEDPSQYEYWANGTNADNKWSFISGPSPSIGTGPNAAVEVGGYAYCEVLPSRVGQTFGLVTPLIDLTEYNLTPDPNIVLRFFYHMHGIHIGNLKVQASLDPNFQTGVEDLAVRWSSLGTATSATSEGTYISTQQHPDATSAWSAAYLSSHSTYGSALSSYVGKRFYIRFLYTAGIGHLGDCAIDKITISHGNGAERNSFKLLHPTHDNHNRPSGMYTRDTIAKRPVNIRNIETKQVVSGSTAGNYLNRYEYINTTSPEANDPWFVKNVDKITRTTAEILGIGTGSVQELLNTPPGTIRTNLHRLDYTLPDRSYLSGTIKNKTRFKARFSSPGGYEVMSRGFLDPAHEIYSVYNAMPWRNNWSRKVHNSQLQAHCGRFGVSAHRNEKAATTKIIVTDGDAPSGMTEKEHITIISTDGTTRRYVITNAASDGTTATGTVLSDSDNTDTGAGTAGASEEAAIAVSINLSSATQNDFLVELKTAIGHQNGHAGKITVSTVPAEANGVQFITLTQKVAGKRGNTSVTTDISQLTPDIAFGGGVDQTARVYGSEAFGSIISNDYTLSGDAAAHKFHRNNIERIEYVGDKEDRGAVVSYVTASVYDNAFVSHMIPRTDQQTRWITASLN